MKKVTSQILQIYRFQLYTLQIALIEEEQNVRHIIFQELNKLEEFIKIQCIYFKVLLKILLQKYS